MVKMERYLRKWQRLLHLEGWNIKLIVRDEANDTRLQETEAYLLAQMATFEATIVLNSGELSTWQASIIHEMLHLLIREHLYGLIQLFDDEVFGPTFERLEERLVARLTDAISKLEGR